MMWYTVLVLVAMAMGVWGECRLKSVYGSTRNYTLSLWGERTWGTCPQGYHFNRHSCDCTVYNMWGAVDGNFTYMSGGGSAPGQGSDNTNCKKNSDCKSGCCQDKSGKGRMCGQLGHENDTCEAEKYLTGGNANGTHQADIYMNHCPCGMTHHCVITTGLSIGTCNKIRGSPMSVMSSCTKNSDCGNSCCLGGLCGHRGRLNDRCEAKKSLSKGNLAKYETTADRYEFACPCAPFFMCSIVTKSPVGSCKHLILQGSPMSVMSSCTKNSDCGNSCCLGGLCGHRGRLNDRCEKKKFFDKGKLEKYEFACQCAPFFMCIVTKSPVGSCKHLIMD